MDDVLRVQRIYLMNFLRGLAFYIVDVLEYQKHTCVKLWITLSNDVFRFHNLNSEQRT